MLMREAVPRSGGEGAVRSAGRGVLCSAVQRRAPRSSLRLGSALLGCSQEGSRPLRAPCATSPLSTSTVSARCRPVPSAGVPRGAAQPRTSPPRGAPRHPQRPQAEGEKRAS